MVVMITSQSTQMKMRQMITRSFNQKGDRKGLQQFQSPKYNQMFATDASDPHVIHLHPISTEHASLAVVPATKAGKRDRGRPRGILKVKLRRSRRLEKKALRANPRRSARIAQYKRVSAHI